MQTLYSHLALFIFHFAFYIFHFLRPPPPLLHPAHLHRQPEQVDEAARRGDVVVLHREARQPRVVERQRRGRADGRRTALEQLHAHFAGDHLTGLVHEGLQRLAQRVEPLPVVHELPVLERGLLFEMRQVALEAQLLERAVRLVQDRPAGGFVDPPALHADQAVLDDRDLPDPVLTAHGVQRGDELVPRAGVARAVHGHRVATLELDLDVFRLVGRLADGSADRVDALERLL